MMFTKEIIEHCRNFYNQTFIFLLLNGINRYPWFFVMDQNQLYSVSLKCFVIIIKKMQKSLTFYISFLYCNLELSYKKA